MNPLWLDFEVRAEREDELQPLAAALAKEDRENGSEQDVPRKDEKLPPIIQDEIPDTSPREKPRDT